MKTGELYAKRKWKLYLIPQDLILQAITGEVRPVNLPPHGVMVDCGYRLDAQGFAILICHKDFKPVPINEAAPLIPLELKQPAKEN